MSVQRVCWRPGARMAAKSSQNRDAIVMTRLVPVTLARLLDQTPPCTIHSSDSSNGDASHNKIHECDDSQSGEAKAGQHHKTPGPLDAGAQEVPRHITHRNSGGCPQNFEPWLPLSDGALCKEEGGGRREARQ